MRPRPNKLKAKLASGSRATGTVIYSWNPNVLDIVGQAGLDYVRLDMEHTFSINTSMEHIMRACYIADIVPIVRVDKESLHLARKSLEIGAGGILIPDIETAEEARNVVDHCKFTPAGNRGYSGIVMAAGFGAHGGRSWVEHSLSENMIGVMIENRHAARNLEEIVAVEGVDFVLIGPADYSMSIGLGAPNLNHPEVQDMVKRTIAACKKHGKYVSLGVGQDPEGIQRYADMGIDMLEMANDLAVLRKNWTDLTTYVNENCKAEVAIPVG